MPRRRALTTASSSMSCSPCRTEKATLVRYWTLTDIDLAAIDRGGAIAISWAMLCNFVRFRYPGRLLRPGELIPVTGTLFCRRARSISLRKLSRPTLRAFKRAMSNSMPCARISDLSASRRSISRELLAWLLPVALGKTSAATIAATLMDELRRRSLIVPGPSLVDRAGLTAAMASAERQVAHQLTRGLLSAQAEALDTLLTAKEGASISRLAWARQPPGAPGYRAMARLVEQRSHAQRDRLGSGLRRERSARTPAQACTRGRPFHCAASAGPLAACVAARHWSRRYSTRSRD